MFLSIYTAETEHVAAGPRCPGLLCPHCPQHPKTQVTVSIAQGENSLLVRACKRCPGHLTPRLLLTVVASQSRPGYHSGGPPWGRHLKGLVVSGPTLSSVFSICMFSPTPTFGTRASPNIGAEAARLPEQSWDFIRQMCIQQSRLPHGKCVSQTFPRVFLWGVTAYLGPTQ